MNTIICYNSEEDQVHVVERVPDTSLFITIDELRPDYAAIVVFSSGKQDLTLKGVDKNN